jgi:hypothetical protein
LLEIAAALEPVSFHLATRNPKELVGMVDAWQRFSTAFAEPDETNLAGCSNWDTEWRSMPSTFRIKSRRAQ